MNTPLSFFHIFRIEEKWILYDYLSGLILDLDDDEARILELLLKELSCEEICKNLAISKRFYMETITDFDTHVSSKRDINKNFQIKDKNKFQSISKLVLVISQVCNLSCIYCYANEGSFGYNLEGNAFMDFDTAKKAVDLGIELGNNHVNFYGGEPLLNFPLIRKIVELYTDLDYSLITNGTLITGEIVDFIKNHDIQVTISLDGPPLIHNLTRVYKNGGGSHDTVMQGINKLIQKDIEISIETTLSKRYNKKISYYDLFDYISKFTKSFVVTPVLEKGKATAEDAIDKRIYKIMLKKLVDYILLRTNETTESTVINLINGIANPDNNKKFYCENLAQMLAVFVNGDIYPCYNACRDIFRIGNIWETNIREIKKKREKIIMKYFTLNRLEPRWYHAITDICINFIDAEEKDFVNSSKKLQFRFDEELSESIEYLIYTLSKKHGGDENTDR